LTPRALMVAQASGVMAPVVVGGMVGRLRPAPRTSFVSFAVKRR
jgi:hypothetical protein